MNKYIRILMLLLGLCIIPMEGCSYIYQNVSEVKMQKSACCKKNSKKGKCQDEKHSCTNKISCSSTISLYLPIASHKVYKKNKVTGVKTPIGYKEQSLLSVYLFKWVPPKIS